MYVERVPNRNSPPAILLRESVRDGSSVRKRTLANLSDWPQPRIDSLRRLLKGETLVSPTQALLITRSLPHGHVAAVLGTLRSLGLDLLISPTPSRQRDLVCAMIVARILQPSSKLALARGLDLETASSSLGELLDLSRANEDDLYEAMDWLFPRQAAIEAQLASQRLSNGSLVLYDLTSTYFEGRRCPIATFGHSRDERSGNPQIVFGLLTDAEGCPVAVEVFAGNTADPTTVKDQIDKLRQRFGLARVILVGDRGTLTSARLREDLPPQAGLDWITALRAPQIQTLARDGALQMSLFEQQRTWAEITHPDFSRERLIACRNPLLADERARKRKELLAATEKELVKIQTATQRPKRPFRGKERIALRVGKVLGRYKMAKHFQCQFEKHQFRFERIQANIDREAELDGVYVIRTSVAAAQASSEDAVRYYKELSNVERAFRSLKSVDLKVRPIHHRLENRVRTHIFLCVLAYYVEWHMRRLLAPMLFDDADPAAGEALRSSVVEPAQRSPQAQQKASTKRTADGAPVHSFHTLLEDLRTIALNTVTMGDVSFTMTTTPTPLQQQALDLLKISSLK
jgi:Transposase DDE domain